MVTVVALVALRLSLGCHFLYEGVWKIKHRGEFTAEPFLTGAKGPLAPLFYAMTYDLDGQQRLALEVATDKKGNKNVSCPWLSNRWDQLRQRFVDYYQPGRRADDDTKAAYEELTKQAQETYEKHLDSANKYLKENLDEIQGHLTAIERFDNDPERGQGAPFQKEQRWNKRRELWGEAAGWIKELEGREETFKNSLRDLPSEEQQQKAPLPSTWDPFGWTRMQLINFAVTYGLTAIGLCLMLGLLTRLAAVGGAGFMFFVVLTTWAWPTVYPPDPPVVGHALLIGKDFVEMMALLVLATTAAGRWGGLDYFVHHKLVEPYLLKRFRKGNP